VETSTEASTTFQEDSSEESTDVALESSSSVESTYSSSSSSEDGEEVNDDEGAALHNLLLYQLLCIGDSMDAVIIAISIGTGLFLFGILIFAAVIFYTRFKKRNTKNGFQFMQNYDLTSYGNHLFLLDKNRVPIFFSAKHIISRRII
jgi:hypothetical protein